MRASPGSGAEQIEIVPLMIVTQTFPARPSSLPDVRDFVRRRLTRTPLPDDDVRTLCDRVAEVLLDAAGAGGTIQVSLRIFPAYAEVDVLFAHAGDDVERAEVIGAAPPPDQARRRVERSPADPPGAVPDGPAPNGPAPDAAVPADGLLGGRSHPATFAGWLSAALRREGLTMEAAARRLNVSAKTVSRWVGGTTEPRLRDLARIRDAFGDPPFP